MKKGHPIAKLICYFVIVGLASVLFISGFKLSNLVGVYDIVPTQNMISFGLDLTGGTYVVLQADETGAAVTDDTLNKAIATIGNRIDSLGLKEPTITKQGTNQIRISIPSVENQQEALDMIGKTAQLEFIGPDEVVILTGANVKNATYEQTQGTSGIVENVVRLEFDTDGTKLFAEATKTFMGQQIAIKLDNETISDPVVQAEITDGVATITGIGDAQEAINLAQLIRAGALPVNFTPVQVETIGPSLGQNSLSVSLFAGTIGILLVLCFMILYYRMMGLAADFSLIAYLLIFLNIMAIFRVTLTLPGFAGIILSIGMAVDSNVIIFERIKEEFRIGKSIFASIDSGYTMALTSIIDSNVTTLIAGSALFFFGSGTIKGFAITLILGVLVEMFCTFFVSKRILTWIINALNISKPSLFGIKEAIVK
jgi:preprotein translocase subunit SecD